MRRPPPDGRGHREAGRAEEVIAYIEDTVADLERRTADIPEAEQKRVYVGGISSAGAHGIISTEPAYPPFLWVHAKNTAAGLGTDHADVAKEALVAWDPEYIFVDVGTTQMEGGGAVRELKTETALAGLSAAKEGRVYGVLLRLLPANYETILANAYFVRKTLCPTGCRRRPGRRRMGLHLLRRKTGLRRSERQCDSPGLQDPL